VPSGPVVTIGPTTRSAAPAESVLDRGGPVFGSSGKLRFPLEEAPGRDRQVSGLPAGKAGLRPLGCFSLYGAVGGGASGVPR
jgi:hypothetical protein